MVIYLRNISKISGAFKTNADLLVSVGFVPGGDDKYFKNIAFCLEGTLSNVKKNKEAIKNANKGLLVIDSLNIEFIKAYIMGKNINSVEIIIPDIYNGFLENCIEKIQQYFSEEEISIGLLLEDPSFIEEEEEYINDNRIYVSSYLPEEFDEYENFKIYDNKVCKGLPTEGFEKEVKKVAKKEKFLRPAENYVVGESFSKKLIRYLNKCNRDNKEIYDSCGMDRKLFSKIISSTDYNPKKETIFCLIIGMQLCYDDALDLLNSAGYTFSKSIISDVIVKKYIVNGDYRIDKINDELDEHGIPILGWNPR